MLVLIKRPAINVTFQLLLASSRCRADLIIIISLGFAPVASSAIARSPSHHRYRLPARFVAVAIHVLEQMVPSIPSLASNTTDKIDTHSTASDDATHSSEASLSLTGRSSTRRNNCWFVPDHSIDHGVLPSSLPPLIHHHPPPNCHMLTPPTMRRRDGSPAGH